MQFSRRDTIFPIEEGKEREVQSAQDYKWGHYESRAHAKVYMQNIIAFFLESTA